MAKSHSPVPVLLTGTVCEDVYVCQFLWPTQHHIDICVCIHVAQICVDIVLYKSNMIYKVLGQYWYWNSPKPDPRCIPCQTTAAVPQYVIQRTSIWVTALRSADMKSLKSASSGHSGNDLMQIKQGKDILCVLRSIDSGMNCSSGSVSSHKCGVDSKLRTTKMSCCSDHCIEELS